MLRDLFLILCILSIVGMFSVAANAIGRDNQTIMQQVQEEFQNRSNNIGEITFLQIIPFYGREKHYLLLAHGIRADKRFNGSWEDELFGLFFLDESFSKLLTVMDIFRSERWLDYSVEIRRPDTDTILAICQGATYGDGKIVKRYVRQSFTVPFRFRLEEETIPQE